MGGGRGESGRAEGSLVVPKQEVRSDKALLRNGQCCHVCPPYYKRVTLGLFFCR